MDKDAAALEDQKLLLDQYKAYLVDLEKIGDRLEANRRFMLSILTMLFVFLSVASKDGTLIKVVPQLTWLILAISVAICVAWFLRLRTYKIIIKSKFAVLHEMEEGLPFKCFAKEWVHFNKLRPPQLTTIDGWIPVILIVAFVMVVLIQQ